MQTSEVLNRAADLIEQRGWTQATGWPMVGADDAPLCLEGGVAAALGIEFPQVKKAKAVDLGTGLYDDLLTCPSFLAVKRYLGVGAFLFRWNDETDRTANEVIEVLRATALVEAARETETAQVLA